MKIITKYLSKTIITYISLVLTLLLGLQAFLEFMHEFPNIGTGNYGLWQVLAYVPLMLPVDIYQFFPMASLLGAVIALGLLATHSELIVLRSAGMTPFNIMWETTKAALLLIIIMVTIGEVVAPITYNIAIRHRAKAMSGGQALITYQGIWIRSDDSFIHIDNINHKGELQGVTRYQFNNTTGQLKTATTAQRGYYQNGQWFFEEIAQTTFTKEQTRKAYFPKQQWQLNLTPRLVGIAHIDTDQKSLPKLYSYIKGRSLSGLNIESYEFIFWQRIFSPLATLVMILLAIPFAFGPLRSTTMGLRMLAGILTGFGFYLFNQFAGSISVVYQVPPLLAALLPTLLCLLLGGFLLTKVK